MGMTVEVPELPELTFDEASHIYRLNGDIIPSVSKLMEPLKDQCYGGIRRRALPVTTRPDGTTRTWRRLCEWRPLPRKTTTE